MRETLTCEQCGNEWTRERARGRKPRVCDGCREAGHKPATIPRSRHQPEPVVLTPDQRAERLTEKLRPRIAEYERQRNIRTRQAYVAMAKEQIGWEEP